MAHQKHNCRSNVDFWPKLHNCTLYTWNEITSTRRKRKSKSIQFVWVSLNGALYRGDVCEHFNCVYVHRCSIYDSSDCHCSFEPPNDGISNVIYWQIFGAHLSVGLIEKIVASDNLRFPSPSHLSLSPIPLSLCIYASLPSLPGRHTKNMFYSTRSKSIGTSHRIAIPLMHRSVYKQFTHANTDRYGYDCTQAMAMIAKWNVCPFLLHSA